MSLQSEMNKLVRAHRQLGWEVEKTRNQHWRFTPPGGGRCYFAAGSPSDHRTIINTTAMLRRALRAS
ncbi:hypothetical protein [Azospirillum argentinense]|uniref:hypothetical protein n=1 Tax=Azospirillum argentinense TaxID=2970906 RepID=UPI0032DEB0C9